MKFKRLAFVAFFVLMLAATATHLHSQSQQDVRAILRGAAANMGADNLKTLRYTASGMIAAPGQGFVAVDMHTGVPEHWPRFVVTNYMMTIDYTTMSSREQYTRTVPVYAKVFPGLDLGGAEHGNQSDPPGNRGGGFIDDLTPRQVNQAVNGKVAWDMQGNTPVRQWSFLYGVDAADYRQLEIVLTPHGFVKAALASGAEPVIISRGDPVRIMITVLGKYKVIGNIQQNLVTDVESWIPNPVAGDMRITHSYTRWKDFGDIKFYTDNHSHFFAGGFTDFQGENDNLQYRILDAKANVSLPSDAFAAPASVQQATRPVVRVESQKLADGVWLIGGESHNSVLLEFRDFVAVVEAPLNDERSQAVIAEVKKLVPNKPIRYVVNTHYHWDHSGGLRAYVAEGAQIVTHQANISFYQQVMFGSEFKLQPDTLAKRDEMLGLPIAPRFVPLTNAPSMISDRAWGSDSAGRVMEFYCIGRAGGSPPTTSHAEDMTVVYLPAQRILINADMYTPPAPDAKLPATPSEGVVALGQLINQYKLNVALHVPIHGQPGTQEQFAKILNGAVVPDSHGPLILPTSGRGAGEQQ
jgi:hypothetical protein